MTVFFTADLHFKHKNIVQYTNRGVETTTESHDPWLVELWNKQVKRQDTVFVLGDISFSNKQEDLENTVGKLNGNIILISGNHDHEKTTNWIYTIGHVVEQYLEIKIRGTRTCLFHFPIASWHQIGRGSWHLHGHSHGNYRAEGKILDVGIDNAFLLYNTHRLFTEQDIVEYMQARETKSVDHH